MGPLDGIVVADFSRVLAGPYCTMLLADLGADVIKVESPAGDDTRHWVPPLRGDTGTYYLAINRNKRSIVLDLSDATDLEAAHALSARADVMIQNFKPGGLAKYGLDYESVRGPPGRRDLLLDQRIRHRTRRDVARLRPARAGGLGADEPDRLAGRTALSRRRRRLRRDDRIALRDRHPGRGASPHADRPRPAHRDQPALGRAVDRW